MIVRTGHWFILIWWYASYHLGLETLALISLTALLVTLSGQVTLLDRDEEDAVVGSHEASYELVFVEKIVRDGLYLLYYW